MFKYVSDIIKNISPQQRLFALFITLMFIFLITFGGRIISAISQTDKSLVRKVDRLEISNTQLSEQNQELQTLIIQSQLQCTKDITEVRKQILSEIGLLEKEMSQPTRTNKMSIYTEDTIQVSMMRIEEPQTNTQVMSHLKKMKQQLQKEIQSGK
jgi:hypothetical protein